MMLGSRTVRLEPRSRPSHWQALLIPVLAIVFALVLFSFVFILAGIDPLAAYRQVFTYAFANPNGLPLTMYRFVFLLLCTYAFIVPYRAGLWNIGMTGQLYVGTLAAFAIPYIFGAKNAAAGASLSPWLVIPLMMVAAGTGGAAIGAIAGFLKGKFDVNEIVVTMMLNFIAFYFVSFMIKEGGPFMSPGGEGQGFKLPPVLYAPLIQQVPFTLFVALGLGLFLFWVFAKTSLGYRIKAHGQSPAAARYAGISTIRIPLQVFIAGGALAGLAGYHYFAAVPGLYKISSDFGFFGDLAFYGVICGLISFGDPLASIPVALLFAGLSVGGRYIQGKLHMSFGVDYALLGVLMISLVAFQFFYRYSIAWRKTAEESTDVGIRSPVH